MRKLPMPNNDPIEVFQCCTSRIKNITQNNKLKSRLDSIENHIEKAALDYVVAAQNTSLHTLPKEKGVAGIVSKQEMSLIYTQRMTNPKHPGRSIYDQLLASAPHGKCPMCAHGLAKTLDHILPQKHYSSYVVLPANLVPACSDCNKAKKDECPTSPEDQAIHPYFDDFDQETWLKAHIIEECPPAITFYCHPPDNWNSIKSNRIKRHFEVLKLNDLYKSNAATELTALNSYLSNKTLSCDEISSQLIDTAESHLSNGINSWQTATYTALSESQWYCNGGFDFK